MTTAPRRTLLGQTHPGWTHPTLLELVLWHSEGAGSFDVGKGNSSSDHCSEEWLYNTRMCLRVTVPDKGLVHKSVLCEVGPDKGMECEVCPHNDHASQDVEEVSNWKVICWMQCWLCGVCLGALDGAKILNTPCGFKFFSQRASFWACSRESKCDKILRCTGKQHTESLICPCFVSWVIFSAKLHTWCFVSSSFSSVNACIGPWHLAQLLLRTQHWFKHCESMCDSIHSQMLHTGQNENVKLWDGHKCFESLPVSKPNHFSNVASTHLLWKLETFLWTHFLWKWETITFVAATMKMAAPVSQCNDWSMKTLDFDSKQAVCPFAIDANCWETEDRQRIGNVQSFMWKILKRWRRTQGIKAKKNLVMVF